MYDHQLLLTPFAWSKCESKKKTNSNSNVITMKYKQWKLWNVRFAVHILVILLLCRYNNNNNIIWCCTSIWHQPLGDICCTHRMIENLWRLYIVCHGTYTCNERTFFTMRACENVQMYFSILYTCAMLFIIRSFIFYCYHYCQSDRFYMCANISIVTFVA